MNHKDDSDLRRVALNPLAVVQGRGGAAGAQTGRALAHSLDNADHDRPGPLPTEIFQKVQGAFAYYRWRRSSGQSAGPLGSILAPYLGKGRSLTVRQCAQIYLRLTDPAGGDDANPAEDPTSRDPPEFHGGKTPSALVARRRAEVMAVVSAAGLLSASGAAARRGARVAPRRLDALRMVKHYLSYGVPVAGGLVGMDQIVGAQVAQTLRRAVSRP